MSRTFTASLLFMCVTLGWAQTATKINPNAQIGGPLLTTNLMLPGISSSGSGGLLVGPTPAYSVHIGPLSTMTASWNFDTTTAASACASIGCSTGGGTVTTFAAPSGSWPAWLVPTVTNSTTAPSLAVAASSIPNSALANPSTTVNGQTCALGSTCTVSGSMVYPGAGVPNSTGSAWGTSYSTSGAGTVLALTASPALTGTPTAPTASPGTNNTQVATTAFVSAQFPAIYACSISVTIPAAGTEVCAGSATGQSTSAVITTWQGYSATYAPLIINAYISALGGPYATIYNPTGAGIVVNSTLTIQVIYQ